MTANFYEQLGVARSASEATIRSAYRALARTHHPDLHGQASPEVQAAHHSTMAAITEAYEVLSNPRTRAEYDRSLDDEQYSYTSRSTSSSQYYSSSSRPPPPPPPRPTAVECEYCASGPARRVHLRRNVGLLFTRRRYGGDITLCRGCGIALFRQFQNSTMIKGWWGPISFFINCGCVLGNAASWLKVLNLDEPSPQDSPRAVPLSRPMPPGPSLFRRAGIWVTVALFLFLGSRLGDHSPAIPPAPSPNVSLSSPTTTTSASSTPVTPYPLAGECVAAKGKFITKVVDCAGPHFALILKIAKSPEQCPQYTDKYFVETFAGHDPGRTVCLSTFG